MKNPKMKDRADHLIAADGTILDQKTNGVRVTYTDGTSTLVLNAVLAPDTMQRILLAAAKPVRA